MPMPLAVPYNFIQTGWQLWNFRILATGSEVFFSCVADTGGVTVQHEVWYNNINYYHDKLYCQVRN